MSGTFDAVVIGGGIAGLAVAAELANTRSVALLEAEAAPATQSSARSASTWLAGYGGDRVRPLTLASHAWYASGGGVYSEASLVSRRGLLLVSADPGSSEVVAALAGGMEPVESAEVRRAYPPIREGVVGSAAYDPDSQDIRTPVAIEALLAALRRAEAELVLEAGLTAIDRDGGTWRLTTAAGRFSTAQIVNAAGAWSDGVAELAGIPPLGLRPLRRSACLVDAPPGVDPEGLPLLLEADETFYVKPESGGLLVSPADETPQPAGPAVPLAADIELGLERARAWTTLELGEPTAAWAGLRTLAPDHLPVLGPDPLADGFAWYAGIGGYGIMTAPGAARTVVSLIDDGVLPADVAALGGDASWWRPGRFEGRA